jgi:hypothetical protein
MMKRDVIDKTSCWFQANIHDLTEDELNPVNGWFAIYLIGSHCQRPCRQ